jgi:outer membrane receptor protein involved in Fe transport
MRFALLLAVLAFYARVAPVRGQIVQSTAPQRAAAKAPAAPTVQQSITVTADRGLAGITDSAASIAVLSQQQLQQEPGLTLDDHLHQVAGFQLFRRTSSWTANPTSQGLSLRGLGSTAASRTLVVSDQVPLNDPFGGWIHWDEIPTLAIRQVELLRGGAADLYGSSAIGGVVEIVPVAPLFIAPSPVAPSPVSPSPVTPLPVTPLSTAPTQPHSFAFAADVSGATENSALEDALLAAVTHRVATLGAFTGLTTGGYITTAPTLRGSVDRPSNVTSQSGRLELHTPPLSSPFTAFLLGNILNESRSNGTPGQTNATRLWRTIGGVDDDLARTHLVLRAYGSRESYRQSFSAIAANRDSETLTRLQRVPLDEFGSVLQAARAIAPNLTAALGADLRDIRATDDETAVATGITTSTSARQREIGGYEDTIWQPGPWSLSGSIRVDSFRTFNAHQTLSNSASSTLLPELDELFASPRLGLVFRPPARKLAHHLALTGTAFRAFRGPTMNELYRTGQVGQQTTLANDALLAERATGFEFGGELASRAGHLRATYFWTEVNRPISAVLLSQTATTQTLQRQNLGQIRSHGIMLEAHTERWRGFDASFGYQLAIATVTAFNSSSPDQANLTGNWIPEVPRESITSALNYSAPRIASFHVIASYEGQEFDDAANQFLLHPYARFDLSAERALPHGLALFASAQNLLNRTIDAGRTPILTLAPPRLVQAGLRYNFSR